MKESIMKFTAIHRLSFTAALLAMPLAAMAQAPAMAKPSELPAGAYTLDKTHASLTWKVSHLGLANYTARFTDFDAKLTLDPKNPAAARVEATINPLSVETDYPNAAEKDFDKELATGAQWFNATKFPTITFKSTKVELTGANTATITGNLTMLGVTKPVTLAATFNGGYTQKPFAPEGVAGIGFSATGTIKRSDWGLATYVPAVGDSVQIILETEFHSAPQVKMPN
ncbi:MAG: YceI family protein [Alphaproteobacteria bacterium]|nr:YceI family protein [Alphaproteobacteria bacterium]